MVSIGTVFTIGIVAAIAAGGYAVYRNADKIGGALSRGVEGYISNPLGSYFENLFKNLPAPPVSQPGPSTTPPPPPGPGETGTDYWEGFVGSPQGPKLPDDKNLVQTAFDIWWNEHFGPGPSTTPPPPVITDVTPPGPIPQSTPPGQAEYYYIDYAGSKYDTQWFLTPSEAAAYKQTAAAPGDAFLGVYGVGKSKLSTAGFQLFGKSQGYL